MSGRGGPNEPSGLTVTEMTEMIGTGTTRGMTGMSSLHQGAEACGTSTTLPLRPPLLPALHRPLHQLPRLPAPGPPPPLIPREPPRTMALVAPQGVRPKRRTDSVQCGMRNGLLRACGMILSPLLGRRAMRRMKHLHLWRGRGWGCRWDRGGRGGCETLVNVVGILQRRGGGPIGSAREKATRTQGYEEDQVPFIY
jgi:hypothetical protein